MPTLGALSRLLHMIEFPFLSSKGNFIVSVENVEKRLYAANRGAIASLSIWYISNFPEASDKISTPVKVFYVFPNNCD